jgi:alginate O-acetyltransferase complex protein AlgI
MFFNSFSFLFLFLPVTLFFFYYASTNHFNWSIPWLAGVSFLLYSFLGWPSAIILVGSIATNHILSKFLKESSSNTKYQKKIILYFGIIFNAGILFFLKNFEVFNGTQPNSFITNFQTSLIIPVAFSFFTFQQIIYLVDTWRGKLEGTRLLDYFLYITFFPQIFIGPILRPSDFFSQLKDIKIFNLDANRFAIGLTIISFGLFKKVVLADGISRYSNSAFDAVAQGATLTLEEAWSGAISFSLQIYFDFSGYSDIAVGLGYLFGFRLPVNFNSPYKASSLISFWRSWNITLSQFVRDYIYIPIGGNRHGLLRRSSRIFIIMLISGVWHGSSATFILWGGAHGIFLAINHLWREFQKTLGHSLRNKNFFRTMVARLFTFLTVIFLWVIFRSDSLHSALSIIQSLLGLHSAPDSEFNNIKINEDKLFFLLFITWFAPNTKEIMSRYFTTNTNSDELQQAPKLENYWYHWSPNQWWASLIVVLFIMSLLGLTQSNEFIYFQF